MGQHNPTASTAPAQHVPSVAINRSNPHVRATSQYSPTIVGSQSHACASASHEPRYEHVSGDPSGSGAQKSHFLVPHGTEASGAGLGHSDSSALVSGAPPNPPRTHRTERVMAPPPQVASHAASSRHSPTTHRGAEGHGWV